MQISIRVQLHGKPGLRLTLVGNSRDPKLLRTNLRALFPRYCSERADYGARCDYAEETESIELLKTTRLCDVVDTNREAPLDDGARSGIVSLRAARCSNTWQAK